MYLEKLYIPVPVGTTVDSENARDMMERVIEDAVVSTVMSEALGSFGTASSVISSLFNAGEQASAVMAAHVVEGVIPFTTALNYIYQKGYVSETDLTLAQDAFGNFMQRVSAVHGTGASSQRYLNAHNQLLGLYSEFHANRYLISFLQMLSQTNHETADISVVIGDIQYALNDFRLEVFLRDTPRISALTLNFDNWRARDIERTYGLGGAFLGALPFFGLFDNSSGVADGIERTSRQVFGNLALANDFATDNLNPLIVQLNVLQKTIIQRVEFLENLLDDPQYYAELLVALYTMPQIERARLLTFDSLLEEFYVVGSICIRASDYIDMVLRVALSPAEHEQFRSFDTIRNAIISHWRVPYAEAQTLGLIESSRNVNFQFTEELSQESQERARSTTDDIAFDSVRLKYDIVWDLRFPFGNTNIRTTDRTLSNGRYLIEVTRNGGPTGPIVMIREFENTGTAFNRNDVSRWTTLYSPGGSPIFIVSYNPRKEAAFARFGELLHASAIWYEQINVVDSI